MKTLNTYINEWKINGKSIENIDKEDHSKYFNSKYFIYKIDKEEKFKIFETEWPQYDYYARKVYVNGEHIFVDYGRTEDYYDPGEYEIEIKDINNINNCDGMFWGCHDLISVPYFDTSKVRNFKYMFDGCSSLENVPLLNIKNAVNMENMFDGCNRLNTKTKNSWSKIYDFIKRDKKI